MSRFLLVIAAAAVLAACAQTPTSEQIVSATHTQFDSQCLKSGTRIRLSDDECASMVPGRSYSQKELEQTGAFTTAEALRRLDPRF